jgi:sugar lactone lactonase YvrE
MMSITVRRSAIVVLIALASGCKYDSSAPERYRPPIVDANEGLWIASASDPAILRLAPAQLLSSGRQTASATITTSSATLFSLNSLAFDTAGTLWIASANDSLVLAFSPEVLATSGLSAASTVIAPTDRSLSAPSSIAFDRLQRLWVANFETGTIVRFDHEQLGSDGAPRPTVIITGLSRPAALAFDASGSLWVANSRGHTVVKFSAAQLEASGAPTPQVVLRAAESSISIPFALAFDVFGNLWVANVGKATIIAFSPEQLTATGSPAPHIELSSRAGSFGIPIGLAFDDQGSLWVVGDAGALHKFAREKLNTTGAPEPSAQLLVNGHTLLSGIAFWPMPLELPIN